MKRLLPLALLAFTALAPAARSADHLLVEAESFASPGGWSLDTQFIDIMGSPYLIAHGLGQPVKDATTTVSFPTTGTYRVWVRTKDWVAEWKAPGTPGKFQVLLNGQPLAHLALVQPILRPEMAIAPTETVQRRTHRRSIVQSLVVQSLVVHSKRCSTCHRGNQIW